MKLLLIQTGGTIDKDYPKSTGAYAFEIMEPAFDKILSKAKFSPSFEVLSFCKKDSQDITAFDRADLRKLIAGREETKVLITHGTDTMIETAKALQNIDGKTIIITGSHLPATFKETDADFQLGFAIAAMQLASEGSYIAMNGRLISAENCDRDLETGQFIQTP
jgi:L-asparaginase